MQVLKMCKLEVRKNADSTHIRRTYMDQKQLGKRIKESRKECGLTADRLSELCHIDGTYLRQIEGGSKCPSLPVFTDICNALHVSPAFLLKDSLNWNEYSDLGELARLWEHATPAQIALVTAMIRTALEHTPFHTQD